MRAGRLLRGCSGITTGGLAILVVILLGSWVASAVAGTPGPGAGMLVGHCAAAGTAAGLQRVADHRADRIGAVAAMGVLIVAVVIAVAYWWA